MEGKVCFVVMNHELLPEQKRELLEKYGVEEVINMPLDIAAKWRSIKPGSEGEVAEAVFEWIKKELESRGSVDAAFAVVHGHQAAVSYLIPLLKSAEITPMYAHTTRRVVKEKLPDGSVQKVSVFKHEGFYEYSVPDGLMMLRSVAEYSPEYRLGRNLRTDKPVKALILHEGDKLMACVPSWLTPKLLVESGICPDESTAEKVLRRLEDDAFLTDKMWELARCAADEIEAEKLRAKQGKRRKQGRRR